MKQTKQLKGLFLIICLSILAHTSYSQNNKAATKQSCNCTTEKERSKRYNPPLSLLVDFNNFKKATDWTFKNGNEDYSTLYFSGLRTYNGGFSNDNQGYMMVFSNQPIKIKHPKNAFTLNITPCFNKNKYYEVSTFYAYGKPIDYDFNNFNYTAKSYFNVMLTARGYYQSSEALKSYWIKKHEYNSDSLIKLINSFNKDYNLDIKPELFVDDYEGFIENLEEKIDEIITQLQNKTVDINNLILTQYILTDDSDYKINSTEEKNIRDFFYHYEKTNFSTNWVTEHLMRGNYTVRFHTKEAAIEVDTNIIKNQNSTETTPILIKTKNLEFSNIGDLNIATKAICKTPYQIANTNISIVLNEIIVTALSKSEINKRLKQVKNNLSNNAKERNLQLETATFSGVSVKDAIIKIPYKKKNIITTSNTIKFNNEFIFGSFNILKSDTKWSANKLKKRLLKMGLKEVKITEQDNLFKINFRNTAK